MSKCVRSRRSAVLFALALPLGVLLWLLMLFPEWSSAGVPGAYAAGTVITVTTESDVNGTCPSPSSCSLRTAIGVANSIATGPVTITFASNVRVITLTSYLPSLFRYGGPTFIIGERNGAPGVVINAAALARGYSGLRITGSYWTIQGVAVVGDGDNYGITLRGHYNTVRNCYVGLRPGSTTPEPNATGILLTNGASHNVIEESTIAGNLGHGISLYGTYTIMGTWAIITPSHHNTITHNYIGTTPLGGAYGNGNKGLIIHLGSHDNYVFDNVIAYNKFHGVYIYGGNLYESIGYLTPPKRNVVMSNTITANEYGLPAVHKRGAVVCDRTHLPSENVIPTLEGSALNRPTADGGYDNIIVGNVISGNLTAGIYNVGASPLISGNVIVNNQNTSLGYGIYNIVFFGNTNPNRPDDDVLSIPYIVNNIIEGNSSVGIISLDTAPARRYELTTTLNNRITTPYTTTDMVQQIWYAGVEVVTGTVTNTVPITTGIGVHIYRGDGTDRRSLGYTDEVSGSVIWLDDAADTYAEATSWAQVREFSIQHDGSLDSWMTHTVFVDLGWVTATVVFPFDGLSTTKPLSDYVGLPNFRITGPYARYQIAEVNFTYDSDQDSVPDPVEGGDETDSDGDGTPDYQDPDSDGDGIPDSEEGWGDTDGDGIPDFQDTDSDGDGIPDSQEAGDDPTNPTDTDGDGIPDYQDSDSDGDGIPDGQEAGDDPTDPTDTDGDGIPDYQDDDSDGDGIPDSQEAGDDPTDPTDTDGDGVPDYQDDDSDGDGIPDSQEAGDDPTNPVDTDDDGVPDYQDDDSDGDGIPDSQEAGDDPTNPTDTDNDEIPDYQDTDSDGDGIPDEQEYSSGADDSLCSPGATDPVCYNNDADGDGIPNYQDTDSDGDGIPDALEGTGDDDGDGIPNYLDPLRRLFLPVVMRSS